MEGEAALCDAKMDDIFIVPKKKMPKRSSKFGRDKSRGEDRKVARDTTVPQEEVINEVIPSTATHTTSSSTRIKYMSKAQLSEQYTKSEKKRLRSEKQAEIALKKLAVASAQCTTLAALAQEWRKSLLQPR